MQCSFHKLVGPLLAVALGAGCGPLLPWEGEVGLAAPPIGAAQGDAHGWGQTAVFVTPQAAGVADAEETPYLLDTGDKLRVFVYAQPSLSRLYTVDQQGMVSVPLIGDVPARGRTTLALGRAIAARLGSRYVKDPQVTVDIAQNRPFFILGEVRNAGQYPFVSGMSVREAVAIAGGYGDRASERRAQITRRHPGGIVEKMDVPPDYPVEPGDTIYIYERWL
jgi:polysaccharide biosynthesis/export protein